MCRGHQQATREGQGPTGVGSVLGPAPACPRWAVPFHEAGRVPQPHFHTATGPERVKTLPRPRSRWRGHLHGDPPHHSHQRNRNENQPWHIIFPVHFGGFVLHQAASPSPVLQLLRKGPAAHPIVQARNRPPCSHDPTWFSLHLPGAMAAAPRLAPGSSAAADVTCSTPGTCGSGGRGLGVCDPAAGCWPLRAPQRWTQAYT